MSKLKAFCISLALLLCVTACSSLEGLDDNPLLVRLAVSQAVLRYVEAGDTAEAVQARKAGVLSVMSKTLAYIDDEKARVDSVMDVLLSLIDFSELSIADQMLVVEAIGLVQYQLDSRIAGGELPHDSLLLLRSVVQTAIDSARYL